VVAAFVTFGLFWGSWAVMLFDIQRAYSLSDAELGVVLAIAIAVAGASSAVMAHLADRVGARRMLWLALVAWSVLLCGLALTQQRWVFVVVLVLTEVAGGSVDTAMNAEASHRLVNHPSMLVRLHALFNTGALVGAATAALVIHAGVSWRWMWPAIAVVGLAVALWAASTDPGAYGAAAPAAQGEGAEKRSAHPLRRLRRDGLVVLLFVFALAEVTEGGVDTWGVLFLRNHLATGVLLGAGAYVVGQAVAATTRGAGGSLLGRLSSGTALGGGGRGDLVGVGGAGGGLGRGGTGAGRGRGFLVLALDHELGEPGGVAARERGGDVHGGGVRGLGGGGADRGMGLGGVGAGPGTAGAGGGGIRGGGDHGGEWTTRLGRGRYRGRCQGRAG
jgi:MFS family permease